MSGSRRRERVFERERESERERERKKNNRLCNFALLQSKKSKRKCITFLFRVFNIKQVIFLFNVTVLVTIMTKMLDNDINLILF